MSCWSAPGRRHWQHSFAELVTYQAATRFRMRIGWLVPAFSLPGQVVRDMVIVYHALIAGPFLSHATIRAIRVRETGNWRLRKEPGEGGRTAGGEKEQ